MLVFIVENTYGTKPTLLPAPFSLTDVTAWKGQGQKAPGSWRYLLVVRPFFKWRSTIFLLFQWGNVLSMVILTMP